MRLIRISSSILTLCEFFGDNIPPYAILSHTWGDEEVTFQHFQSGHADERAGYSKIERCCAQALQDGYEYVWIDTCCIDKSSSAELSEAINSMFQWYQNANVCYAYLSDVPSGGTLESLTAPNSMFRRSRWFTRGWTLQELIAPEMAVFFDCDWNEIGSRSYLRNLISTITGIENVDNLEITHLSVAQKMSWASQRKTTRLEDEAYCLLGIFGVNMPLLYGEGKYAFGRLQQQILSQTDDDSIFAWTPRYDGWSVHGGMLASSPSRFKYSGGIERFEFDQDRIPHVMTNRGLRMEVCLYDKSSESQKVRYILPLNCKRRGSHLIVGLMLERPMGNFQLSKLQMKEVDPFVLKKDFERRIIYVQAFDSTDQVAPSFGFSYQIRLHGVRQNRFTGYCFDCFSDNTTVQESDKVFDGHKFGLTNWCTNDSRFIHTFLFKGPSDVFVVELNAQTRVRADISIFYKDQPFEEIKKFYASQQKDKSELFKPWTFSCTDSPPKKYDRVSKRLPSGKGVSATIKRRSEPGESLYWLDITIEPEGTLRWPDPYPIEILQSADVTIQVFP